MTVERVAHSLPVILERLHAKHPGARYELDWETPLQLLVATILAAQCTDERVNKVTKTLFKKYPDAKSYAEADISVLEEDLKPTGFYREKAKKVQNACKDLVERFGGEVPKTMEEMTTLYGVARKTANVVLNTAFKLPTGVIVDTHVHRVSQRMGLTEQKNPDKIELDLMKSVPKDEWIFFGPAMVLHGRYTCTHHNPDCENCVMNDLCPRLGVGEEEGDPDREAPVSEEDSPTMATKKTKTKPATASKSAKTAPTRPAAQPTESKPTVPVPSLREQMPADWQAVLQAEFDKPYFKALEKFVAEERSSGKVFPPPDDLFAAFHATPFEQVKVVLLGQDPYHGEGEAHGMAFSVRPGVKVPPSLVNMYKELHDDLGIPPASHGYLASWANQGVLLLNTVLTVKANQANSHKEQGWETFTDAVIKAVSGRKKLAVFLLWGSKAHAKEALIDSGRHRVLKSGHPSPLSAKAFFGTKPFSRTNETLKEQGQEPINWYLPPDPKEMAVKRTAPAPTPVATPAPVPAAPTPTAKTVSAPVIAAAVIPEPIAPPGLEALLPEDWRKALAPEVKKPYFRQLDQFLASERQAGTVCPAEPSVFEAFHRTPLASVKVVIVGQEPQSASDVCDGMAWSVREGVDPSDLLKTIGKELRRDLGCRLPLSGSLAPWARQGVLLLNHVLTVREGRPGSHNNKGWETFSDAVVKLVSDTAQKTVFVFLGNVAPKKKTLIDQSRHVILTADHPGMSPDDFLGCGIFSEINRALDLGGRSGVYWQLPYA